MLTVCTTAIITISVFLASRLNKGAALSIKVFLSNRDLLSRQGNALSFSPYSRISYYFVFSITFNCFIFLFGYFVKTAPREARRSVSFAKAYSFGRFLKVTDD